MRSFRIAAALVICGTACVPLPGNRALTRRTVLNKQGENTLVATDGSWCRVPAPTFERVQLGASHTCVWRDVGADGSGRAEPDARPIPNRPPGR